MIVPSSTAYISPVNLNSFKNFKNLSENKFKFLSTLNLHLKNEDYLCIQQPDQYHKL